MSTRDWLRYSGPVPEEERARFNPRWQSEWEEKCSADCCYSPACGNIRCTNCYKSIVVPTCRPRYYCMKKDCVDYCGECFNNGEVMHEHAEFLCISEEGVHTPVTRTEGVGEFTLDMLLRFDFNAASTHLKANECSICTEQFADGERLASIPPCKDHGFHIECIKPFVQWCNNCPNCLRA